MPKTQFTSTDARYLYVVRFRPGGEIYFIEAANSVTAHQKGTGHAALDGVLHNGCEVRLASEDELDRYYSDEEE